MKKKLIILLSLLCCLLTLSIAAYASTTYYRSTLDTGSNSTLQGATRYYEGRCKYIAITPTYFYGDLHTTDLYVALYRDGFFSDTRINYDQQRVTEVGRVYIFSMGESNNGNYYYYFSTRNGSYRDGFYSDSVLMSSYDR